MKLIKCLFISLLVALVSAVNAVAQEWHIPERIVLIGVGHGEFGARLQFITDHDGLLGSNVLSLVPSIRYSPLERLQIHAELPLSYAQRETIVAFRVVDHQDRGIGDLFMQLLYEVASGEDWRWVLNVGKTFPTGKNPYEHNVGLGGGHHRLAAGLTVMQIVDPVVLFAHLGYQHSWARRFDIGQIEPEQDYRFRLGFTLAMNPRMRTTIHLSGNLLSDAKLNDVVIVGRAARTVIRAGAGLDWDLDARHRIAVDTSFGITENTSDAFIAIGFKRRF
jgi:hypothetical protein